MMNEITHTQAQQLAAFIHTIRRDWDPAGIVKALGDARGKGPVDLVAHAAIRAAMNPKARTPAIIGRAGEHWAVPWREPDRLPPREVHCPEHDVAESLCRGRHVRKAPPVGWRDAVGRGEMG